MKAHGALSVWCSPYGYTDIQRGRRGKEIPAEILEDLPSMLILAPLLACQTDIVWSIEVCMTGSSPLGGAVFFWVLMFNWGKTCLKA